MPPLLQPSSVLGLLSLHPALILLCSSVWCGACIPNWLLALGLRYRLYPHSLFLLCLSLPYARLSVTQSYHFCFCFMFFPGRPGSFAQGSHLRVRVWAAGGVGSPPFVSSLWLATNPYAVFIFICLIEPSFWCVCV